MGKRSETWLLLVLMAGCQAGHGQGKYEGFDPAPLQLTKVQQTPRRSVTSADLLAIRDLRGVSVAPDGKSVAFVLSQAVYETNSYRSGLFVVGTGPGSVPLSLGSAGPPRWNSGGEWESEAPQWSPDSRYITYRIKTNGLWQIWRWRREGGRPRQLTHGAHDVDSYEWSPDGGKISFKVRKPFNPLERQKAEEHGILYDGWFRPWNLQPVVEAELEKEPRATETWVYDIAAGSERKATSWDQRQRADDWKSKLGIWDEKLHNQVSSPILDAKLAPDGKRAAYRYWIHDADKSLHWSVSLHVQSLDGGMDISLTPSAYFVGNYWWSRDGHELFFTWYEGDGRSPRLFAVSPDGGTPRPLTTPNSGDWLEEFSLDATASRAACIRQSNTTPPEVALIDLQTGEISTLVNVNPEFKNLELSEATRIEWKSRYGEDGYGYLLKPRDYERGKRIPLIVTTYRSGDYFVRGGAGDEYPAQVFCARGFAVLAFDAGKSLSYKDGDFESAMLNWRYPLVSLEAALSVLDQMGIVDSAKRGITGLSYGAEIVDFTISHSDLFEAASESQGGSRDPYFYYMAGREWHEGFAKWGLGGWPEGQSRSHWKELSLSLNADHVMTPLLINTADTEYLLALSSVTSLEQLGKPVEAFIYANELHIKSQPKHRYEIYERNLDWFSFWLQDEEDPDPKKADQYKRWRELRRVQEENESKGKVNAGAIP